MENQTPVENVTENKVPDQNQDTRPVDEKLNFKPNLTPIK